ncbi:hypothetical protein ACLGIH_00940 [Streptomyces sp. HMX87]|uniref:hypothetical protein n=1 Tax=Streptomyces sp. HMX87 TaxID=3390849 RepID=UPI003A88CE38
MTTPHRKFKKSAPPWYERGVAHLRNWRAPARHLGRREDMGDTVQAIAALLSHQQTVVLGPIRQT